MPNTIGEVPTKELEKIEQQSNELIAQASSIVIDSAEDVKEASVFLRKIKDALNNAERTRTNFTQPINQALRNINAEFKAHTQPLEKAYQLVSQKVIVWNRAEAARLAELERRRKIQETKVEQGMTPRKEIEIAPPEPNTIGHAQMRKVWTYELEDFSKLPDKYKMINQPAINAAIRAGTRSIGGLKIYQKDVLATV